MLYFAIVNIMISAWAGWDMWQEEDFDLLEALLYVAFGSVLVLAVLARVLLTRTKRGLFAIR